MCLRFRGVCCTTDDISPAQVGFEVLKQLPGGIRRPTHGAHISRIDVLDCSVKDPKS